MGRDINSSTFVLFCVYPRGGDDGNAVERMTSRVFLCSKATPTCTCCDRAEQEEEEHDARDPAEYFMP